MEPKTTEPVIKPVTEYTEKRPKPNDYAVRRRAAAQVIQPVMEWADEALNEEEQEVFIEDIADALNASPDAYAICRYLETKCGWFGRFEPDTELVYTLDDNTFLQTTHNEMVEEWVKKNHPSPSCEVGDQIAFNWTEGTWTAGVIRDIYAHLAVYLVSIEHLDAIALVPYEDARLLPREEIEEAEPTETLPDTDVVTGR